MIFPKLIILDEDINDILLCKMDWSELDSYKIKKSKEWISQFILSYRTLEEENILKLILNEYDWESELYPSKFKNILSILDSFKIPKSYYNEIKHLEELSLNEWNRKRIFDTNVREKCLEVSIKAVALYFYLIKDAIYIWNSDVIEETDDIMILESVSLFRFWKGQTGSSLVCDKSLECFKFKNRDDLYNILKDEFQKCLDISPIPFRDENKLRDMIRIRLRDEKIKNILD